VIYLKSALAGAVAVLIVVVVTPFVMLAIGTFVYGSDLKEGVAIGWDPVAAFEGAWIIPLAVLSAVFASVFYWRLRRLRKSGRG
jgi:hypothetical protein